MRVVDKRFLRSRVNGDSVLRWSTLQQPKLDPTIMKSCPNILTPFAFSLRKLRRRVKTWAIIGCLRYNKKHRRNTPPITRHDISQLKYSRTSCYLNTSEMCSLFR